MISRNSISANHQYQIQMTAPARGPQLLSFVVNQFIKVPREDVSTRDREALGVIQLKRLSEDDVEARARTSWAALNNAQLQ